MKKNTKVIVSLEVAGPSGRPITLHIGDLVRANYGLDQKGDERFVQGTVQGFTTKNSVILLGYTTHNMPQAPDKHGVQYIVRLGEGLFVYFIKMNPPLGDDHHHRRAA